MIARQYSFTLPADYDMGIIGRRVDQRGHVFDELDGLFLKAFLVAEKGVRGSQENLYAPFYLWHSDAAMADFFRSEKFKAVCEAFGRPAVRVWTVLQLEQVDPASVPAFATREIIDVPASADLGPFTASELAMQRGAPHAGGLHSRLVALDPRSWDLLRFTLYHEPSDTDQLAPETQCYDVLRLSSPFEGRGKHASQAL